MTKKVYQYLTWIAAYPNLPELYLEVAMCMNVLRLWGTFQSVQLGNLGEI